MRHYSSLQMSICYTPSGRVCVCVVFQLRLAHRCLSVHPPDLPPSGPSAHELRVALGARYYDIHPDPHGLRGRGHHVVEAVVGFHTEGQRRVGTLEDHSGKGETFRLRAAPVASFSSETFVTTTE